MDAHDFRRALSQFATGVAVATTVRADGTPHGVTINSLTSVSLEPPLISFCLTLESKAYQVFQQATALEIYVLSQPQEHLARLFAYKGEKHWPNAVTPLFEGALVHMRCQVQAIYPGGDHAIFLCEVEALEWSADPQPLLFFRSQFKTLEDEKGAHTLVARSSS